MSKLSKVLIIIGVILLVAGFGIQMIAANNSDFKMLSEVVESMGEKMTPQFVGDIVNNGVNTGWGRITIDDLLSFSSDNGEAAKIVTYAKLYAATPIMIYAGIGCVVLGFVLLIANKRK